VESNHLNFSGTGFVNGDNVAGSYLEWTVSSPIAGTATLAFRYSNGTTTDRPAAIAVNGTTVNSSLSFPPTANWDTWATQTITTSVVAGSNKIRATANTANGNPNFDYLDFDPPVAFTDYQAENATISQGVVESNHLNYTGTGFVNGDNVAGSYVEFTVNAPVAGSYTLAFRYSNGTTTNRPADISVNGTRGPTRP
jgi:hypothetical protein